MPHPFLIFSQSDYLIQIVDINSHTEWQTVQIQVSWLQKPTDLDLHCLQRQDISGFSRTRVKNPTTSRGDIVLSLLNSESQQTCISEGLTGQLQLSKHKEENIKIVILG